MTARDVGDYDALMQRLVTANANVKRFRTRVALDTLKRSLPCRWTRRIAEGAGRYTRCRCASQQARLESVTRLYCRLLKPAR